MTRHTHIIAALLLSAAAAQAQTDTWLSQPQTTAQVLADRLATLGQFALEGYGEPTPGQLLRARTLFDMALELNGDDPQLWRLRGELARAEQDTERQTAALRQYARLRPADDAAQLMLILQRVEQEQTVDARLNMVERLLASDSAQALSAPLRSRLASYAAAGAREIGDTERFARWLKEALRLDDANAQAAQMTYDYTVERTQDPAHVGAALVHLVRADPANPQARLALARLLMDELALKAAVEQDEMASLLARSPLPLEDWQRYVIAMAAVRGPAAAISAIDTALAAMEQQLAAAQQQPAEGHPPVEGPPPGTLSAIELLRLALLHAHEQTDRADASFAQLKKHYEQSTEGVGLSLPLAAAVFNRELDLAEAEAQNPQAAETARQRLRGWLALRGGDAQQARNLLDPLTGEDAASAYGAALAQDDDAARHDKLRAVAQKWPHTVVGAMAMVQLRAAEQPMQPTAAGASLLKLMERTPRRVWYSDLQTESWVALKLDVIPPRVSYLEPIVLQVTLRNVAGVPLAVGPRAAAPSRLWLTIEPTVGGQSMGPQPPIVVDLARTLRLDPGQSITHRMRLDRAAFGYLRTVNPMTTFTWRLSGVLDPYANPYGVIQPGPLGTRVTVTSLNTVGTPATPQNIDLWLADMTGDDDATVCRAVARLMGALANVSQLPDQDAVRRRIADALNDRYANTDRPGRAWIVSLLPLAGEHATLLQRVTDDAERSDDPMIRLTYLTTTVRSTDDNTLLAALRHDDPAIRGFAEALKENLDQLAAQQTE